MVLFSRKSISNIRVWPLLQVFARLGVPERLFAGCSFYSIVVRSFRSVEKGNTVPFSQLTIDASNDTQHGETSKNLRNKFLRKSSSVGKDFVAYFHFAPLKRQLVRHLGKRDAVPSRDKTLHPLAPLLRSYS